MGTNEWRFLVDRLIGYLADGTELHYVEIGGPSTVTKPTTTPKGAAICSMSIATEDDTGVVSFFSEVENDWVAQCSFQG